MDAVSTTIAAGCAGELVAAQVRARPLVSLSIRALPRIRHVAPVVGRARGYDQRAPLHDMLCAVCAAACTGESLRPSSTVPRRR